MLIEKIWGNPILGLAIGIIMVAPGLINGWSSGTNFTAVGAGYANADGLIGKTYTYALFPNGPKFFQWAFIGYQAQVFPALLIIALAYLIEKLLRKITPEFLAIIVVPLGTTLLSVFLGFLFIGPIGRYVGYGLGWFFTNIFTHTNYYGIGFGGAVFGFAYPFLVVTGIHQGLLPIEATIISETTKNFGHAYTWITPIATVSNISQGMVALALLPFFIKKSPIAFSKALSGSVSANLGITEPVLFGVNLPSKFGLIAAACAAAVGGYWVGMTHTVANSIGSASWLGLVLQFDYATQPSYHSYLVANNIHASLPNLAPVANMAIASAFATVAAFGFTFLFAKTYAKQQLKEFINANQKNNGRIF